MLFAERNGFEAPQVIQINTINSTLRNRLYNAFRYFIDRTKYSEAAYFSIIDCLGYVDNGQAANRECVLKRFLFSGEHGGKWYTPYTIIELYMRHLQQFDEDKEWVRQITEAFNRICEEERSGYRLVDGQFVPITNSGELEAVQSAVIVPYEPVKKQIEKAIESFSNKDKPDYENTIKDAISAVESMCCIITGLDGRNATLGNALEKLEASGVRIHDAMKEAFNKLYHYSSNEGGIRHGATTFPGATEEDARFMLVACSAFVNYLITKYERIKVEDATNE